MGSTHPNSTTAVQYAEPTEYGDASAARGGGGAAAVAGGGGSAEYAPPYTEPLPQYKVGSTHPNSTTAAQYAEPTEYGDARGPADYAAQSTVNNAMYASADDARQSNA